MAFVQKKDYCGFAREGVLVCSSEGMGETSSDVESQDENGDVAAFTTVFGGASPTNGYDIKADVSFTGQNRLVLGSVATVDGKKYMATGVTFSTNAGAESTFSASAVDVEAGAETGVVYRLPAFTLPKTHRSALLFSEVSVTGAGCNLASANYAASVTHTVSRDEYGVAYASTPSGGVMSCDITINQTGTVEPTLTSIAEGWHVSGTLTRTNSKGAYPVWTAQLKYYLERVEPTAS